MTIFFSASPILAQNGPDDDALSFAKGDYFYRHRQFSTALMEFGHLSKDAQQDPMFRKRIAESFEAMYRPNRELWPYVPPRIINDTRTTQQIRVTRRTQDSNPKSDQSFDDRGWQINEHLEADTPGTDGIRANFVMDLDGFRDGHNDLRYRTLLADFYEGRSHLGLGDSATFTSPYFMRGSRLRGADLILNGPVNEFQVLAGAYPVWLEGRDEYIYPRTVLGMRDRVNFLENRVRVGANVMQSRDNEKIRTDDGANPSAPVSPANQPRDNTVISLDQDITFIPDIWTFKAAEAYSITDDNLLSDRFGNNTTLKDSAFQAETHYIHPWFKADSYYERTGPDFRMLTDFPSGAVNSPRTITADREFIRQFIDFKRVGPIDLSLEGSWIRSNLDQDATLGQVRQSWYTANLHLMTPRTWPRIGLRETLYDTTSIPGSTTRPASNRTSISELDVSRRFGLLDWSGFSDYQTEHPLKDHPFFNDNERWSVGTRLAHPLGKRILLNGRYKYQAFNELFDEVREQGIRHEVNGGGSVRLWSTASLSLNYTYLHGKLINPGGTQMIHAEAHSGTLGFAWPYTHTNWDKRRKLSISPGVTLHISDFTNDLERRPLFASYLSLGYDLDQWLRFEVRGEYGYDHDQERADVRSAQSRIWFLWTAEL